MTQIRPDNIVMTTLIDTYINYKTTTSNVAISGTVAAGATQNFFTSIDYTRSNTRADLYAKNTTTGIKRPVAGGSRQVPYTAVSTETCSQLARYGGSAIVVTFSVFNGTGASINLVPQTLEVTAVFYEVPY